MENYLTLHTRKKSFIACIILLTLSIIANLVYLIISQEFGTAELIKLLTPAVIIIAIIYTIKNNVEQGTTFLIILTGFSIVEDIIFFFFALFIYEMLFVGVIHIVTFILLVIVLLSYNKNKNKLLLASGILYLIAALLCIEFMIRLSIMNPQVWFIFSIFGAGDCLYNLGLFTLFFVNMYLENHRIEKLNQLYSQRR